MFIKAAAVLALAANALAQIADFAVMTSPGEGLTIAAGSVFNIEWLSGMTPYSGPVKIELLCGATPSTLEIGRTVGDGIDYADGSFAWNVDGSLGSDTTYGIKITLESDPSVFQYSFPFKISGNAAITTSSSSTPATKPSISASTTPVAKHSASAATTSVATPSSPAVYTDLGECDDDEYTGYSSMSRPVGVVSTGTVMHTVSLTNSAKPTAAHAVASGYLGAAQFSAHGNGTTTLVYQPTRPVTAHVAVGTAPTVGAGSVSGSSASASSPVKVSGASPAAVGRLVVLSGAAMALFAL